MRRVFQVVHVKDLDDDTVNTSLLEFRTLGISLCKKLQKMSLIIQTKNQESDTESAGAGEGVRPVLLNRAVGISRKSRYRNIIENHDT